MPTSRLRPIISAWVAVGLALLASGAPAALPAQAAAQIFLVDRTDDVVATACSVAANDCSLRGAVQNANANPGSTIALNPASTYLLTNTTPIIGGQMVLSATTTLNSSNGSCLNAGACAVIMGGPGWSARLLTVAPGAVVTVDHVKFTGGNDANGGGLMNSGTLTLTSSQVFSNTSGGWGGGILNFGTLTISNTVLNGNRAATIGGAITNQSNANGAGIVTLINSLVVTNSVTGSLGGEGSGGGIASFDNVSGTIHPVVSIIDSSILSNTGVNAGANVGLGGGLFLNGHNTLTNVTVQNNSDGSGGGIFLSSGQLLMQGGRLISNTGVITGGGGGLYLGEDFTLVAPSASLTNVTLQGNSAGGGGGANVGYGTLTLQGGSVVSNTALTASGSGGGFRNDSQLSLNDVLISDNQTIGGGGGGISSNGPLTITNSTLSHNNADGGGGAIWLSGFSGRTLIDHSSLLSNTSSYGGAVGGYGTYTVTNSSVISGNSGFQGGALNVSGGGRVWISGSSQVANNHSSGGQLGTAYGGAIWNAGVVQIQDATVSGNIAQNGSGGGLYNAAGGQASLAGAAVVGNQAQAGPGGGIANLGVLTVTASAIISNSTLAAGGGISNTGTLSLLNTTLSGNSAAAGSGLQNSGAARLNFVTVAANKGLSGTGGLVTSVPLTLSNSLLADNLGTPFDCTGTLNSLGHNLIGHTSGCTLSGPGTGDKLNIAPLITSLLDQGGALRYHDLLAFSPALEAADPAGGACPATDQRGVARPIHPRCDIGAIESSAQAYYDLFLPLAMR